MQCIYIIKNLKNGLLYVGLTSQPEQRWKAHQVRSLNPKYHLHRAMRKHGIDQFRFTVVATAADRQTAAKGEAAVIWCLKTLGYKLYNLTDGGENPPIHYGNTFSKGLKRSEEMRANQSAARKGIPSPLKGVPSGQTPWNKGKTGCQEAWNKGLPWSDEVKAKQSAARLGVEPWNKGLETGPQPPEQIAKRVAAMTGRPSKLRTLTYEVAQEIRAKRAESGQTETSLATEYKTTRKVVQQILRNKTYRTP